LWAASAATESDLAKHPRCLDDRPFGRVDPVPVRADAAVESAQAQQLDDRRSSSGSSAAGAGWPGRRKCKTLAVRYRKLSSQLARAWAICGGSETLAHLHPEVRFYEEVRVWMAKFDADDRQSRGEPIPEEIQRLLGQLIAQSTVSGEVLDIYDAAGMPKPTLSELTPDFVAKTQQASNPHLAIEGLRKLLNEESTKATRNNVVRQRAFSERLNELMNKYTNQQLTSAEVIAELIDMA
jgi:type I restriction enzyme, R subunit